MSRLPNKRTIKLRQADAQGREFIRVADKSIQWASCGKKNGQGSSTLAFKPSQKAQDLMSLGEGLGQAGAVMTGLGIVTFGATALIGIPTMVFGVLIKQSGQGMHWVAFHENKKPCDPHEGLL